MKMFFALIATTLIAGTASAACTDGTLGTIEVKDSSYDSGYRHETRVCRNGSFLTAAEKAAYNHNPKGGCTEGNVSTYEVPDASYDSGFRTEYRTCKNGTYMNAAEQAAYVRIPKNHCKEGSRFSETIRTADDNSQTVVRVCRSKKWIVESVY